MEKRDNATANLVLLAKGTVLCWGCDPAYAVDTVTISETDSRKVQIVALLEITLGRDCQGVN